MRKLIFPPDTLVKFPSVMGDGSDGTVVISVNTTLTRDMHYLNLTINTGIVLSTAGFRIFVKNTFINKGTIRHNGAAGAAEVAGAGAAMGTLEGGATGGTGSAVTFGKETGRSSFNSIGGSGGAGGTGDGGDQGLAGSADAVESGYGPINDFIAAITGRGLAQPTTQSVSTLIITADQSIPNASETLIAWSTIGINRGRVFDTVLSGTTLIVSKTGNYLINASCTMVGNATGIRVINLKVNGADAPHGKRRYPWQVASDHDLSLTKIIRLTAGDSISIAIYQNSGVALNIYGGAASADCAILEVIRLEDTPMGYSGGAGGGGGSRGATIVRGGGGGGGGGIILIAANILDNSAGVIEAKGGAGGNGTAGENTGGGGGGGGGAIILVSAVLNQGTTTVTGGGGGSGVGTGAAGAAGSSGQVITVKAL